MQQKMAVFTQNLLFVALSILPETFAALSPKIYQVRQQYFNKDGRANFSGAPTITIGTPVTLTYTSKYGTFGELQVNTWELFFRWVNEQRGGVMINGVTHAVELLYIDDVSDGDQCRWAAQHMIAQGVRLFLGPYGSAYTKIVSDVVCPAGAVMVAPIASSTATIKAYPRLFGTQTPDSQWLVGAFETLSRAGGGSTKTVMSVAENVAILTTVCNTIPGLAAKHGMTVLQNTIIVPDNAGEDQMSAVVAQFAQKDPDIVFSCVYRVSCHALLRQMRKQQWNARAVVSTICVTEADFLDVLGSAGQYVLGVALWLSELPLSGSLTGDWTASSYAENYQKQYGKAPPYQAISEHIDAVRTPACRSDRL